MPTEPTDEARAWAEQTLTKMLSRGPGIKAADFLAAEVAPIMRERDEAREKCAAFYSWVVAPDGERHEVFGNSEAISALSRRLHDLEERARRAEEYAGSQPIRSDFRTADDMRAALDLARAGERRWQEIASDLARDIVPVLDCWVNGRRVRDGVMLTQREAIEAALARYEAARKER